MSKSTRQVKDGKATGAASLKPYPEFPLTPHPSGRWCKKIRGKLHYFGSIADPDAALSKWERERDYLLTGRSVPANPEGVTIADLCNGFLIFKRERVTTAELSEGMFAEYKRATDAIVATFGKGRLVSDLDASDFGRLREYLARGRKFVALGGMVRKCRIAFKWGYDAGLLDRPPRYGQSFNSPSRTSLRKERAQKGRQDFTADEIRAMVDAAAAQGKAGLHLRVFVLLGVNAGLGASDIAGLHRGAVDLDGAWLDYPRAKTAVARRCKLWPETVSAMRAAIAKRPRAKSPECESLLFLTPHGHQYVRYEACRVDGIAEPFRTLCKAAGIEKNGRGFYSLRRTLATVADGARDPVAARFIMGHSAPSSDMGDVYRQAIDDERLQAVAEHVRRWLFPPAAKQKTKKPK